MAGTIVGVFQDHRAAEEAAQALLDDGVPLADIALVAKNAGGETGSPREEGSRPADVGEEFLTNAVREVPEHDVERPVNHHAETIARGVVGFVVGGPILSLAVALCIYLPGAEALFTAHPLMPQLGAGVLGGIIGALVGALTAGGVPEDAARAYHQHVERGETLVTALSSGSRAAHLQEILKEHGGRRLGYFPRFLDSIQSAES